ncbi:MAG: 30S ribosomal protein S9 [Verrucomicrobiales bacterium]|nr:30S ribosomal protein S9 [Verrucomicrobiae bacterium]MCC6881132.1 30S ribosomal protein S9 [Verrucomicrobiales bacterium]MCP5554352.1 30S ribosomal protein S9 [Akkermansiaceae bacterium]HRX56797.1 30S ribosomal protein S9 [Verrucomicrobiales bacterium]
MSESPYVATATGRRKTAVARVLIKPGTGEITINGRTFEEYFPTLTLQNQVIQPFQIAQAGNKYDTIVSTRGGGVVGQVGAVRLGIARALLQTDPELRKPLKVQGLLTRDSRKKERKKPGQPGARKRFQFSKR